MKFTIIIRITAIVLTAVCWISAFVLFWKKPGEAVQTLKSDCSTTSTI